MREAYYCSNGFRERLQEVVEERSDLFNRVDHTDGSLATENQREKVDKDMDLLTRDIVNSKLDREQILLLLNSIIKVICPVSSMQSKETIKFIQSKYPELRSAIIDAEEEVEEISDIAGQFRPFPFPQQNVQPIQQNVQPIQQNPARLARPPIPAIQPPVMQPPVAPLQSPIPVTRRQSVPPMQPPVAPIRQQPPIPLQQSTPSLQLHPLPPPVQPPVSSSRISIDQIYRELEHPSVPLPELKQQVERLAANPPLQLCIVTLKKTELVEYLKQNRSRKKSPFVNPVSVKQLSPLPVEGNYIDLDKEAVQMQHKPVAEMVSVLTGKKTGYLLPITRRQLRVPHAIMVPRQVASGTAVSVYVPLVPTQFPLC